LHAKFHPDRFIVSPLREKNPNLAIFSISTFSGGAIWRLWHSSVDYWKSTGNLAHKTSTAMVPKLTVTNAIGKPATLNLLKVSIEKYTTKHKPNISV